MSEESAGGAWSPWASASGKVILLGEHAVVYGVPGIAAGIERGARARARVRTGAAVSKLALGGATHEARIDGVELDRAFAAVLKDAPGGPFEVEAEAELPPGGGLGCSAALAVSIVRAVDSLAHENGICALSESVVAERATEWERVFHGNPSGIDTAAAAVGGCMRFVRGEGTTPIAADFDLWLAVGFSGSGASTKEMVDGIAKLKERKPALIEKFLEGVRSLVENAERAIESGDGVGLGKLLDLNQMLLAGVMLSTEEIETMCRVARDAGALGAKLTGKGGGGSVIALGGIAPKSADDGAARALSEKIATAWNQAGFKAFASRIACAPTRPQTARKEAS